VVFDFTEVKSEAIMPPSPEFSISTNIGWRLVSGEIDKKRENLASCKQLMFYLWIIDFNGSGQNN
jgi:hypothetical protein